MKVINRNIQYGVASISLIAISLIAYVNFFNPYMDHDSVIYAIIGRAINNGYMPYTFAFDHKPVFTYYIYAIMHEIYPFKYGLFVALSLVSLFSISLICCKASGVKLINIPSVMLIFLICSYNLTELSGNTEFIFTALSLVSIWFITKDINIKNLAISAALSAASFNTNYLACIGLAPALLFLLAHSGSLRSFIKNLLIYSILFAISNILIVLPIYLFGGKDVFINYFELQKQFLTSYGEKGSLPYFFFAKIIVIYSSLILALIIKTTKEGVKNKELSLIIFCAFSFIGCLASGKDYGHYAFPFVTSIVFISVCMLRNDRDSFIILIAAPLFINLINMTPKLIDNNRKIHYREFIWENSKRIKDITGDAKVMAVKSGHIPFYFGELNTFQPFIWASHTGLIFGNKENQFYNEQIMKKPPFILTYPGICDGSWSGTNFCKNLQAGYKKVLSTYSGGDVVLYEEK
ncbi:MAG: hypothetical protein E6Z60_14555 [Mixta calida]|nr:hypothetical protein [Mixta calida]